MEKSTPKLRFSDYIDNWKRCKLKDISVKINSGKTPLGGESVYTNSGILFIRSQNVLDSNLSFENSTYIDEKTNNTMKNSVVMPLDILLNITGASLGRSCVVPSDFTIGNVNQHVCIIRLTKDNNSNFIQSILASEIGQTRLRNLSTGSGREGLNFQSIKDFDIYKPSYDEQTKIATFLSAVDEKLNLLKEKKAALEEYKKGMMQKIFSQEIRFKDQDGNDFPEWEEKSLGEICDVNKGTQLNRDTLSESGLYPCISGGIEPSGYALEFNRNENTIIISEGGNSCGYVNFITTKFWCGGHCYSVDLKDNSFDNSFLFQVLKYNQDEIMKLRVGSGLPNIQKKDLLKFNLSLSIDILEQTKIASFLSTIDEKLELVSTQINETQEYKKGLLQQMFC